MKNIFLKDPEKTINYLTPKDLKRLLATIGIKLALAAAGMLAMPIGSYDGFSKAVLMLLLFAFVYDVCCLYQACLHITQGVLMGFLLFLVLISAIGLIFQYGASLFAGLSPDTAAGENILTGIMALVFLVPLLIDIARLAKLLARRRTTE